MLTLNVRLESSIYSQDYNLAHFFSHYKFKDETSSTQEVWPSPALFGPPLAHQNRIKL